MIRRVRRAAGADIGKSAISSKSGAPAIAARIEKRRSSGTMARGDEEDSWAWDGSATHDSSSSDGGAKAAQPSLSERLRRQEAMTNQKQEQQRDRRERGGALSDADHSSMRSAVDGSIESGWSWASSPRSSSVRGRTVRKMDVVAASFPKRDTAMAAIKQRIANALKCVKNNDEMGAFERRALLNDRSKSRNRAIKIGVAMMMALAGVFQIGRWRGRRFAAADDASESTRPNNLSMNDEYMRYDKSSLGESATAPSDAKTQYTATINENNTDFKQVILPRHLSHLSDLTSPYDSSKETPYFWDVHFSGESIAEAIFSRCHGLVHACEFGLRQPDYDRYKLGIFTLDGTQYVNVDTTTKDGIQRASRLGLANSHLADVIISPHFNDIALQIFSLENPGRLFGLFRHPVDRAVAMHRYLARASWDPHYNPDLSRMTMEQYARSRYIENNFVTRFLVGKPGGKLTAADLSMAKKILRYKCLVGLFEDLEVSMARFQRYFSWNTHDKPEGKAGVVKCRATAVVQGDKNVLGGILVQPGSVAWNAIVQMNQFDMKLFEYARTIYKIQGEKIFDVVGYQSSHDSVEERSPAAQLGKNMAAAVFGQKSDALHSETMTDELKGDPSSDRLGVEQALALGKSIQPESQVTVSGLDNFIHWNDAQPEKNMAADVFEQKSAALYGETMAENLRADPSPARLGNNSMSGVTVGTMEGVLAQGKHSSMEPESQVTASRLDNLMPLDKVKDEELVSPHSIKKTGEESADPSGNNMNTAHSTVEGGEIGLDVQDRKVKESSNPSVNRNTANGAVDGDEAGKPDYLNASI